jgi:hypothetical protein
MSVAHVQSHSAQGDMKLLAIKSKTTWRFRAEANPFEDNWDTRNPHGGKKVRVASFAKRDIAWRHIHHVDVPFFQCFQHGLNLQPTMIELLTLA